MITVSLIIFLIVAVITLGSALMVVTARNLVHAALWLVVALFGVAILFGLLQAGFLAVVQVVIYIGAIVILIIFAIMLTQRNALEIGSRFNENWGWALGISALVFAALVWAIVSWPGFHVQAQPLDARFDSVAELGKALVASNGYALPFELASVLLLAALIGAIVIAWERKPEER
ncbi:MAG: NADH-quinone oxidoreductase subunit J [Anaerolineales bacterium]|jgi:NADH-quinone oxidoreductase subunit J|nr:NADH-quinone oxidoreductase subunit J [Anaerolineales bacterium]